MSSDPKPDAGRNGRGPNPFDTDSGYSGQEYHRHREQELIDAEGRDTHQNNKGPAGDTRDTAAPPEAGQCAWIDPDDGTVHGAGSGAGGGNPGEDYDSDAQGGGGAQIGVERENSVL